MSGSPPDPDHPTAGSVAGPDVLLARRAAAGHEDAWRRIVDEHGGRIFNLALQYTKTREEAEDLTQDVFVRLYRKLRTYRGEVPLVGWALRLSRNLLIDHYRKMARERSATHLDAEVLEHVSGSADPHADAAGRRGTARVHAVLRRLPPDLAEVLTLRDLLDWTGPEVAAYLDIAEGTVKSRLFRARRQARELLAAAEADDEVEEGRRHVG